MKKQSWHRHSGFTFYFHRPIDGKSSFIINADEPIDGKQFGFQLIMEPCWNTPADYQQFGESVGNLFNDNWHYAAELGMSFDDWHDILTKMASSDPKPSNDFLAHPLVHEDFRERYRQGDPLHTLARLRDLLEAACSTQYTIA